MANFKCLLILSLVLLVISIAGATQFKVGGSRGWSVPSDPKEYSQWAHKNRFRIGDSLLFVYRPDVDSVLFVEENAYRNCDTSSPVDLFRDGNTVFVFTRSGPHYFISGNRDNCLKNESFVAVVMAERTKAPPPSAPPPPPSDQGSPPHNGATSKVVSLIGLLGAFVGSLFFVF